MRDTFSTYHPGVNALWFVLVLAFTVTSFHPVLLLTALACALPWSARLGAAWRLRTLVLLFLVTAVCNPLFSHPGVTTLAYFPTGNPLTMESILFGGGAGLMLLSSFVLLSCAGRVLTADKWMCLLGRPLPVLSLLLSMALGFLPRFGRRLAQIRLAQQQVGLGGKGRLGRFKAGIRDLSVLVSWSLEDALITADSMSSRGYGLPGRTAYTNFTLDHRDRRTLALISALGGYLSLMALHGSLAWRYYPALGWAPLDGWSLSAWAAWGLLCALPLYLNWKEDRAWNAGSYRT